MTFRIVKAFHHSHGKNFGKYYLMVKNIKSYPFGEWHDVKNDKGNVMYFDNLESAERYAKIFNAKMIKADEIVSTIILEGECSNDN